MPRTVIIDTRQRYNQAIADRDPGIIATFLSQDYQLLTSLGRILTGRDAVEANWRERFAHDADVLYVRNPTTIMVSDEGNEATESGVWSGHYTESGTRIDATGTYEALWVRRSDDCWLLRSERFQLT